VLRALSQLDNRTGQTTRSIELSLSAARASGATSAVLRQIAGRFAGLGLNDRAEALYREAVLRDGDKDARLDLGAFLAECGRWDEADAIFAGLAAAYPLGTALRAARRPRAPARRHGGELARLREAQQRAPSSRNVRERIAARTGEDPIDDFFTANLLDLDALRTAYDASGSKDSVVKLVDHAVVMIFPDGGVETVTQDLYLARDLSACEQLGQMQPKGEVLRIATIKPDGTEFEPVGNRELVMPNLKPGDCVVMVTRSTDRPPNDGVLRPGSWSFASVSEPFVRSSYVIWVPKSVPLRLVERQYAGQHEVEDQGGAVVHRFALENQRACCPSPTRRRRTWFLPWVEFGMDAEMPTVLAAMDASVLPPTQVTPEIREAADKVTAGLSGDVAKAKALHAFVNETLDQRGWQDATQSLLQREGNASFLFAALLEAAGVPRELVWSRNVAPDADDEPDPPFIEPEYWSRNLLVLVQPRDGDPTWCDMNSRPCPTATARRRAGRALGPRCPRAACSRCRRWRRPSGWASPWTSTSTSPRTARPRPAASCTGPRTSAT
jgi:hypothetical protein